MNYEAHIYRTRTYTKESPEYTARITYNFNDIPFSVKIGPVEDIVALGRYIGTYIKMFENGRKA